MSNTCEPSCGRAIGCLGEESLCWGFGEFKDIRNGRWVTITKINSFTVPHDDGESVGTHIDRAHENFNTIDDTFRDAETPGGGTIQYKIPLSVGDTVTYENCVYENLVKDNTTRPGEDGATGWLNMCEVQETIDTVKNEIECDGFKILSFASCDELDAYRGTEECPLRDGQPAIVMGSDGCTELYFGKRFETCDATEDECNEVLAHVESPCSEYRWISYSSCHKPPQPPPPPPPPQEPAASFAIERGQIFDVSKGTHGENGELDGDEHTVCEVIIPKNGTYDISVSALVWSPNTAEGKGIIRTYKGDELLGTRSTNDSRSEYIRTGGSDITIDSTGSDGFIVHANAGQKIKVTLAYHNQATPASGTFSGKGTLKAVRIGP